MDDGAERSFASCAWSPRRYLGRNHNSDMVQQRDGAGVRARGLYWPSADLPNERGWDGTSKVDEHYVWRDYAELVAVRKQDRFRREFARESTNLHDEHRW